MKKKLLSLTLLCMAAGVAAQEFTIRGYVPDLPDSTHITLNAAEAEDKPHFSKEDHVDMATMLELLKPLAEGWATGGKFELKGTVKHPMLVTLATSDATVSKSEPGDARPIHFTSHQLFLSNTEVEFRARSYADMDVKGYTPHVSITGGRPQQDWTEYLQLAARHGQPAAEGSPFDAPKGKAYDEFIATHHDSPVSVMFAMRRFVGSYSLTAAEIDFLERNVTACTADTLRWNRYTEALAYAKQTTKNMPLLSLPLVDLEGEGLDITSLVGRENKYTFIDFWASWCAICLGMMPHAVELQERYGDVCNVIAVSCDKHKDAWKKAIGRVHMPFSHYCMTEQGIEDFRDKYAVKNGVPYYLLVDPMGRVVSAPGSTEECYALLDRFRATRGYEEQELQVFTRSNTFSYEAWERLKNFRQCQQYVDEKVQPLLDSLQGIPYEDYVAEKQTGIEAGKPALYLAFAKYKEEKGVKMEKDKDFVKWVKTLNFSGEGSQRVGFPYVEWYATAHPEAVSEYAVPEANKILLLNELFTDQTIKDELADSYLNVVMFTAMLGAKIDGLLPDMYAAYLRVSTNEERAQMIRADLPRLQNKKVGAPAAAVELLTPDGKATTLKDIVGGGKATYIDLWATWCGPCVKEIPALERLVEQNKDNANIRFVSISIDENHGKWQAKLAKDNPAWEQYIAVDDAAFANFYGVGSIPRFLLFDKEGKMLDSNAPRPSEAKINETINSLK